MHRLLVRWHMLVAAFLFPAILMFLVTGALYTWGSKGEYVVTDHEVALAAPLTDDPAALKLVAEKALGDRGLAVPTGGASVKKVGDAIQFEWTGANRDIVLEAKGEATTAKLTVRETGWHRFFVQLHKAKGGTPFKVYAAVVALGLFFLVTSGLLVAMRVPNMRRGAIGASIAGVVAFAGIAALS
ncbi:MAG: PepSY domain-containing protein [Sphingopyxis sp.]|uniref:PepSY domain-containing protein n=1 Tax=Sphingopyxis sp. TaxID=1908224 RepID=UPI001A2C0BC1|nr:PepSY domain-containing protein [Sphingopyxis sp.]MBJ7498293.1 PepSY domain-containing protein [Sphingopyxis sp.]